MPNSYLVWFNKISLQQKIHAPIEIILKAAHTHTTETRTVTSSIVTFGHTLSLISERIKHFAAEALRAHLLHMLPT
jgi:hypothetical protein